MPKGPSKSDDEEREALDRELDQELKETFPASDPPKVTRVPRRSQIIGDDDEGAHEDQHWPTSQCRKQYHLISHGNAFHLDVSISQHLTKEFTVGFPLGGQTSPPAPQPIRARY